MCEIKENQKNNQGFSADAEKPLTSASKEALLKEELALESQVMSAIRKRQKSIPQLTITNFGYLVRLGKRVSPGCQSCNEGKWEVLHCNTQCNCSCRFCPEIGTLHLEKEKLPRGYYNIHAGIYDEQALKL
ncbi:MAG: hypothetical protein Q8N14_01900, partial [Candidatus Omnitrophota bacterium]|nr:hypothetical protein [Candidatus Omnitrophota bacterium]